MKRPLSEFFTPETARGAGYEGAGKTGALFPADPLVTGLEYDSRNIKPGNLYFALPGLHTDGRRYISDAIRRGAPVIVHEGELPEYAEGTVYIRVRDARFAMSPLAAAFYGFPSRRLRVIGVTGTEGKSTTVYLIWQLLRLLGKKAGFFSTVQYSLGDDECWNPEHQTTPEAPAVQKLLWEMAEKGAEYAVVEASSHGLSERTNRLGDVDITAAVFTNVTHEHLEFHGTREQYRFDKANLFRALDRRPEKAEAGPAPFGVVNADDASAAYFAGATRQKTVSFSVRGMTADLSLKTIESSAWGNWYEVAIAGDDETVDIRDQLPGAFNAGNVLAALLTVSGLLAVPVRDIIPLVSRLKPVRGRMTAVTNTLGFEVLVDYAHTPSSFLAVFPPLRERINRTGGSTGGFTGGSTGGFTGGSTGGFTGGRIISLFGSAGERDTKKRSEQGRIAAEYSDIMILTDEDPRGEKPMDILEEIAAGAPNRKRGEDMFLIPDRPAAIRKALSLAKPGDIVILLGKGHENSIIYAEKTISFDEIRETERALEELTRQRGERS